MAQADISHFRDFPEERRASFKDRVKDAVAKIIYGVEGYKEIPFPNGVTARTFNLDPKDSDSDSPSGTEVMVDLDFEEWPRDEVGIRISPELLSVKLLVVGYDIGALLKGGVMNEPDKPVNVWPRQMVATGWYDGTDYESASKSLRSHFAKTET